MQIWPQHRRRLNNERRGGIDASESASRIPATGIYCRNISENALPPSDPGANLTLEDGIYAEVNRLLPRKSEVIEC